MRGQCSHGVDFGSYCLACSGPGAEYPTAPGYAVTRRHLEASGLTAVQVERVLYEQRLSEARLDLLRELVAGRECEQRGGRGGSSWKPDCGTCTVCRCRYVNGALRVPEDTSAAA